MLLTLPAATALSILAFPILAALFERGAFGPAEAAATSSALIAYAVGLPAFVLVKVLAPAFFARHDTKTPVKVAIVAMAANLLLTLLLMRVLAHVGDRHCAVRFWMAAGTDTCCRASDAARPFRRLRTEDLQPAAHPRLAMGVMAC